MRGFAVWKAICSTVKKLQSQLQPSIRVNRKELLDLSPMPGKLLVFRAMLGDKRVVFKICQSYGVEVHRHMEAKGYAPKLHHYEELHHCEEMGLEYRWVVMDEVCDSQGLDKYLQKNHRFNTINSIKEDLSIILECLREKCYVHGALLMSNILISGTEARPIVHLIGFDWSGRDGGVIYPPYVNTKLFVDASVAPMQPIKLCHDFKQVDYIRSALDYN